MWAKIGLAVFNLLQKYAPLFLAALAYLKGKSAMRDEVNTNNLEKQKEYAEIRADKSGTIDDDLDRLQKGTF